MRDASDMELLREYARQNSEAAFAELVCRHVNLVYSAALRHVGIAAHAEEITQAVFVILARKAASLRESLILEAWLFETTRLTALSFLRGERRRQFREQEAYMESILQESTPDTVWQQLAPLLDDAMMRLGRRDREAVVLRFFKGRSLGEVAAALNIKEPAAQKRVSRALEKLRRFFAKRGVDSTTAAIAETISANSVLVAPVALAKTISAVAITKGAAAGGSSLALVKGALKIMAWTKVKTAIVVGVTILVTTGTTTIVRRNYFGEPRYQGVRLSAWLERISAVSEARQTPMTDRDRAELSTAQDAVQHMRVRAVPQLSNWAATTNPVGQFSVPAYQLARFGFATLGPAAQPAVGKLTELLGNPSPLLRGNALTDLAAIGNGAVSALPALINCLTNDPEPYIRYWAAGLVGDIGTSQPEQVIPVLASLLNPTNASTLRNNSMQSLAKFQAQADQVVPILTGMLNPTNDVETRVNSLQCLARFQVQARSAVPAIAVCLNDESPDIRATATNVLRRIDPEAAIRAGVRLRARPGPRAQ